jgi:hypothetical protein
MSDPAKAESKLPASNEGGGMVPIYLWPNLLGLDAVAVALVWLWCFADGEHVPILRSIYWILGLAVWVIYTADRLYDAQRMRDFATSTPRHQFAKRFWIPLALLAVGAFVWMIYLVLFDMPRGLIKDGVLIAMFVLLYFFVRMTSPPNVKALLPKEICCGAIFALGTVFSVYSLPDSMWVGLMTAEFLLFVLLCGLNCTAISIWEWQEDEANRTGGGVVKSWPTVCANYVKIAFFIAGISAWLALRGMEEFRSSILVSISLSAALISKNLRRALVDVALLSPLVVLPLLG